MRCWKRRDSTEITSASASSASVTSTTTAASQGSGRCAPAAAPQMLPGANCAAAMPV
ncbi:hypothetical protein FHT07_002142 [Xanthomonas arboricola]|nr:hypothetical protein [Xanthomonas arboricola]